MSEDRCPTCGRFREEAAQRDEEGRYVMTCPDAFHMTADVPSEEGEDMIG